MLPIIIDVKECKIVVVGDGPATARRLAMLEEAGAGNVVHYTCPPLEGGQPNAKHEVGGNRKAYSFKEVDIVFIADFDDATSAKLYNAAKQAGALVNVEDKLPYCDFHVPAMVRRSDLLLTVSTGGASPRLARRFRYALENLFPTEWADRLTEIREHRKAWKAEGSGFEEVAKKTDALLDSKEWLAINCECMKRSEL